MDTNKHELLFDEGAFIGTWGRSKSRIKSKILAGTTKCNSRTRATRGAVLLEVVLALVLFVAAATIIGSALNTSANGVERLRLSVHAADLATSVLSELQIGSRNAGDGSPEPFAPPFDTWMWQVTTLPVEEVTQPGSSTTGTAGGLQSGLSATDAGLVKVEVTVRDTESDFVYRLSQIMSATSIKTGSERSGTQLF